MKKLFAALLIAVLALSATALAATYTHDDLTFEYEDTFFRITMEDHTDDEDLVILTDKNEGSVRIHLRELEDGEAFPTAEEIARSLNVEVEKLDTWANFKNVLSYQVKTGDIVETVFIAPVYDEVKIDEILTVNIIGKPIEDEDAAMESSDCTSEVVDTLKVIDD